jgi:hypothetical protein
MINLTGLTITRRDTESHQSQAHYSDDCLERFADGFSVFHNTAVFELFYRWQSYNRLLKQLLKKANIRRSFLGIKLDDLQVFK